MGLQRVRRALATEQQQQRMTRLKSIQKYKCKKKVHASVPKSKIITSLIKYETQF